nr:MAG TPA: hypothetical protein [Caudoviricetes sp.]
MRQKTELAWERQPGESEEAYEAFTDYYKNPKRSQKKTAKAVGKSEALIYRWSVRWHWTERAREYDNALVREEYTATLDEIRKMNKAQAAIGLLLQKKGQEALEKLNLKKMSAKDLLQFLIQGTTIERRARLSDVSIQNKKKAQEESSTEYADDGLSAALETAAKKVWKQ